MKAELIKKLARSTVQNGKVNAKVAKYVIFKLARKELIMYLTALKNIVYENSVRVISAREISPQIKQSIKSKFKNRVVFFEQDKEQGEGLIIIADDTIIDLTVSGYIKSTIEQLKA